MSDVGGDPHRGMTLADVTGDGLADLLTPNPDHVAVVASDEDGGFRPRATLPAPFGPFSVGGNPYGLATGDFDGDRRIDFAVANDGGDYVSVFLTR